MSISIGIVIGGDHPTGRGVVDCIRSIRLVAIEHRTSSLASQPEVNVVFYLSGHVMTNDFTGIRTGSCSRKRRIMMIQVAVPEAQMWLEDHRTFVFDSIRAAVRLAAIRFARERWQFSVDDHVAFVDKVERIYASQTSGPPQSGLPTERE